MKAAVAWVVGIVLWIAVTYAIFLALAAMNETEGTCDPATAWDKCASVSGPGPGNGR